jgi:hypothetical protein
LEEQTGKAKGLSGIIRSSLLKPYERRAEAYAAAASAVFLAI